jgi:hypothetical protein
MTDSSTDSTDFPRAWLWDADGDIVKARFVKFDVGPTKLYGKKPIAVLDVDGEQRSVWLTTTVLFAAFKEELETRDSQTLNEGELITIRWLGKAESKAGGPAYHRHKVVFHDSPGGSPESLFGLGTPTLNLGEFDTGEPVETSSSGRPDDSDIPY